MTGGSVAAQGRRTRKTDPVTHCAWCGTPVQGNWCRTCWGTQPTSNQAGHCATAGATVAVDFWWRCSAWHHRPGPPVCERCWLDEGLVTDRCAAHGKRTVVR